MSTFERDYKTTPQREIDPIREFPSIELSDADYRRRMTSLQEMIDLRKKNAQSKNERPESKPKKLPSKRNKAVVEIVQEEL